MIPPGHLCTFFWTEGVCSISRVGRLEWEDSEQGHWNESVNMRLKKPLSVVMLNFLPMNCYLQQQQLIGIIQNNNNCNKIYPELMILQCCLNIGIGTGVVQ
jgi:hypothetical protein